MKKIVVAFITLTQLAPLTCCPTCIGLPRDNHERPFFERKSFVAALQQSPQKEQKKSQKKGAAKLPH
jgi:hypothetical protein